MNRYNILNGAMCHCVYKFTSHLELSFFSLALYSLIKGAILCFLNTVAYTRDIFKSKNSNLKIVVRVITNNNISFTISFEYNKTFILLYNIVQDSFASCFQIQKFINKRYYCNKGFYRKEKSLN